MSRTSFARLAFLLGLVTLAAAPAFATAWPKSDIPPDPAVTFGVLDNGMRYAIMHNSTPSGAVSIRFRIAAGAMQERPDQRGLAHFLEHMAFRGSAHVPDGEINKTLERLGLRFGADTNASTGQDETVYQFDLPRSDDQTVDTALNFTREIASNLTLDPAAAKTEAGVVLSELKLRELPSFRAMQAQLDFLLQDVHATALANGDPAIIAQAPVGLIRDFYQAYYRPERATLIIVGDVDPARIEAKIKAEFADWKNSQAAGSDPRIRISRTRGLEAKLFTEKGAPSRLMLAWIRPPDPKPETKAEEKSALMDFVALRIMNRRLQDVASQADRPFTRAAASEGDTLEAAKIVSFSVGYEPGKWQSALDAADAIRLATLKSGVTQQEVDRVVSEMRAGFHAGTASSGTRVSRSLAGAILGELSDNDIFTSPERDEQAAGEAMNGLTADTVNKALRDLFPDSAPLIFMSDPAPVEGGEQALKTAFLEAEKAGRAAPAEIAAPAQASWPYTDFGKPGEIVSRQEIADLGTTFLRFANGVRLTVRPSQLRANQVLVSVKIGGGQLDLPKGKLTAAWAAGALTGGGLKALSFTQMQRALTPKVYRVGFGVGEDGFVFSGGTTPADLNTQLQVFVAYVTQPGFRPEAFEQLKSGYAARLRQVETSPAALMRMKAPEILHDGDKRWAQPSADEVKTVTADELRALLTPAFANGAIDVTIVGDITTDQAANAVAATFGALPPRSGSRASVNAQNNIRLPAPALPINIAGAASGQTIVTAAWPTHGRFPDVREDISLQMLSDIMQERLFDRLRGLGTVYVAQVGNSSSKVFDYGYVEALAQLPPDQAHQFYDALQQIVADLKAGKLSEDDLARARNPALEELRKAREGNEYWLSVLDDTQENPAKLALARDYEAGLQAVTAADVVAAANKYLAPGGMIRMAVGS